MPPEEAVEVIATLRKAFVVEYLDAVLTAALAE